MFDHFLQTATTVFESARRDGRLIYNPSDEELRSLSLAEPDVRETKYGSLMAQSEPMSRAANFTKNNVDTPFGQLEHTLAIDAEQRLARETIVSIDVAVGDGTEGITARLIVPKRFAHLAFAGRKLFTPTRTDSPTYQVLMFCDEAFALNVEKPLPQKDISIRIAFSPEGRLVKIVRNSNYFGEWKKGVFTGEDYRAKQNAPCHLPPRRLPPATTLQINQG